MLKITYKVLHYQSPSLSTQHFTIATVTSLPHLLWHSTPYLLCYGFLMAPNIQHVSCLMALALTYSFLFQMDIAELPHHSQVKFIFSLRKYSTLSYNLYPFCKFLFFPALTTIWHLFVVFDYGCSLPRTVCCMTAAFLVYFVHSYVFSI